VKEREGSNITALPLCQDRLTATPCPPEHSGGLWSDYAGRRICNGSIPVV